MSEPASPEPAPASSRLPGMFLSAKSFKRAAFALVIGMVAALTLPHVMGDEFGVRIVARVYAPVAGWMRGTDGRDQVSVLLIDDRSLQRAQQSWPASYGYYARLLDALVQYRPRAVFIDVVFAAQRDDPSLSRLADATCRAAAAGTRVYFAARRSETGSFDLRPELQAMVNRCFQPVAIEYNPDALDQVAWSYRIVPEQGTSNGHPIYSAAASIYRDFGGRLPERGHETLALNWGLDPAAQGVEWLVQKAAGHGELATVGSAADHAGHGDRRNDDLSSYCRHPRNFLLETALPPPLRKHIQEDVYKPLCVFHNTLYPADLATGSQAEDEQLASQLRGRVVMVGTALQGSNDRVISPLHGSVPGVFMHAAALDNLLHYQDAYKRDMHLGWNRALLLLLPSLLVMMAVIAAGEKLKTSLPQPTADLSLPKQRFRAALIYLTYKAARLAAYVLFFTAMVIVGQKVFDLGMLTVADIAFFTFLAEWLEWGEKLEEWWDREPAHQHTATHGTALAARDRSPARADPDAA